jgi:uncharacterized membrane protein
VGDGLEAIIVVLVVALLAIPALLVVTLVLLAGVRRRVTVLEQRLAAVQAAAPLRPVPAAASSAPAHTVAAVPPPVPVRPREEVVPPVEPPSSGVAGVRAPAGVVPPASPPPSAAPSGPSALERALAGLRRWFSEGNVPVKVGMLVLLAGVAALLKYAGDQGWLTLPVALRYAGIAAAALVGLVFGWRQRAQRRGFALALQGGAIGVLLLVVFAAFKLNGLLPSAGAFAISVVLVAGLCVLAVLQESRTLAVLGILAGFLAPIWLSTGSGNHVALFGYYALLNAAVFAIAWVRAWRVLNLLGFAFTFGIGTLWGVLDYTPAKFASTEPFLLLFFAMYLLIPVLHARRGDPGVRVVDGSLLFGTPLVAFALQAGLLQGERMPLALCALGLALLYALLAAWLVRAERTRLLGQGHAVLAVAFATLAVPLALSARVTASVFALEGAGMVWLGLRQHRALPQVAGALLQLAAAVGFAFGVDAWAGDALAIANPTCMSALLIVLGGLASAWCWHAAGRRAYALLAYLWALAWWAGAALHEIARFAPPHSAPDLLLVWLGATAVLAAGLRRRRPTAATAWTAMLALALALPTAWWQVAEHLQPFAGAGGWAWLLFALAGVATLVCLRDADGRAGTLAQHVWWLLWPMLAALLGDWLARRHGLADGWRWALLGWPWLALAALSRWRWHWLRWPQGARLDGTRAALQRNAFAILVAGWLPALCAPLAAAPLPWLPLLNPAELVQLAAWLLLAGWLWSTQAPAALQRGRVFVVVGGGLLLVTASTLHAVHHWGGLPWDARLPGSGVAQTSLTVVWSVLGVIGWVLGSRRGQRGLWLTGASLMALVLAKLVLLDRQHLGNLLGIGSFIAYGLLCTVVGYLAPAPPRAPATAATEGSA